MPPGWPARSVWSGSPARSTPPSAAGWPAARCMSLPRRRPCISAPPADLPLRWPPGPAASAGQCSGSPPIMRSARAAAPTAPASTCSAWPRRGCWCCACRSPSMCSGAMEDALRCRALACVIAELTGDGAVADLTATRRLALAAREGVSARDLRLRPPDPPQDHRHAERGGDPLGDRRGAEPSPTPMAASAARASTFRFARTGAARPAVGSSSGTIMSVLFQPAVSVGVAAPALDRPDRAPLVRAG